MTAISSAQLAYRGHETAPATDSFAKDDTTIDQNP
jgi:hypothetical protein